MRKGFNSSRGAIRGTIGGAPVGRVGTGGFATVAISFGPFLCSCLNSPACCRTEPLSLHCNSGVGRKLPWLAHKLVPAFLGAEENSLSVILFRNRKSLGEMHTAHRVSNQLPRHRIARHIHGLIPVAHGTAHTVHQPPEQGNTPGRDHHPKEKSENARNKCHRISRRPLRHFTHFAL